MNLKQVECGFIPLVDAAPLIVAHELGFAEEEGLNLVLRREKTWSALRDKIAAGRLAAAHMLSPMAIAISMGLGGLACKLTVPMLLSANGVVVGASKALGQQIRDGGAPLDINDARAVGARLIEAAERPLRFGTPFPFSMHVELLNYWLAGVGLPPDAWSIVTVPPPMMSDALAAGEIDLFCVGEPWGSRSVDAGVAEIILAGAAIWKFAPEKALALRADWAEDAPASAAKLMRAVWRAGRWLSEPDNRGAAAEFMSWPHYLAVPPETIERAFFGRLQVTPEGYQARTPRFVEFFECAAMFPWRSQALWIAHRLAERHGIDAKLAERTARATFRPDLYRANLGPAGADLPGASEKIEGALTKSTPVASSEGRTYLGPDDFFDGAVFEFSP